MPLYQPPGTPEVNAIEHLWFPIKHRCKRMLLADPTKNYTQEEFMHVVVEAATTVTKRECCNMLRSNLDYLLKMLTRKQEEAKR